MDDLKDIVTNEYDIQKLKNLIETSKWGLISLNYDLTEKFIRKYQNEVNWFYITEYQKFSEEFIREFQDKIHWNRILKFKKLSDELIRDFADKVDWVNFVKYQKVPDKIALEYHKLIDWDLYFKYQTPSYMIVNKFLLKSSHKNLDKIDIRELSEQQIQKIEKILLVKNIF
jgi:hypothetical protein